MKTLTQGQQFDRLTALIFFKKKDGHQYWRFRCSCGTEKVLAINNVTSGQTKSCGCRRVEVSTKHGLAYHPLYKTWEMMIQRCTNPKYDQYNNYGGRGIKVCDSWREFPNFLKDVGEKPSEELTLDRKNNEGNYEPGNVRWATRKEQQLNGRLHIEKITLQYGDLLNAD